MRLCVVVTLALMALGGPRRLGRPRRGPAGRVRPPGGDPRGLSYGRLFPTFADIDGDGKTDLLVGIADSDFSPGRPAARLPQPGDECLPCLREAGVARRDRSLGPHPGRVKPRRVHSPVRGLRWRRPRGPGVRLQLLRSRAGLPVPAEAGRVLRRPPGPPVRAARPRPHLPRPHARPDAPAPVRLGPRRRHRPGDRLPRNWMLDVSAGPLAGKTEVVVRAVVLPAPPDSNPVHFGFADSDGDGRLELLAAARYHEVKDGPWRDGLLVPEHDRRGRAALAAGSRSSPSPRRGS